MSAKIPQPGAIVPVMRNPQLVVAVPIGKKLATGAGLTTHPPGVKVDMYMLRPLVKSSKNAWGTPWLSTTMLENCSFDNEPLTICGVEKANPAPGE